jgi:hypothetical protein
VKQDQLRPKFVEFIPETLEDGVLYVALEYRVVAHRCCCGCGSPVYLPLSPTQWQLTFDGEAISMKPSIGSWSLPCQSHYWIRRNRVHWAAQWTLERVEAARGYERRQRDAHFAAAAAAPITAVAPAAPAAQPQGRWARIRAFFRRG